MSKLLSAEELASMKIQADRFAEDIRERLTSFDETSRYAQDVPRLLAHIEALTPVVEAAEQWDRASQDMFDHIHGWCTEECSEDETDSLCARGQQLVAEAEAAADKLVRAVEALRHAR